MWKEIYNAKHKYIIFLPQVTTYLRLCPYIYIMLFRVKIIRVCRPGQLLAFLLSVTSKATISREATTNCTTLINCFRANIGKVAYTSNDQKPNNVLYSVPRIKMKKIQHHQNNYVENITSSLWKEHFTYRWYIVNIPRHYLTIGTGELQGRN